MNELKQDVKIKLSTESKRGCGYCPATNTLFVNQRHAINTISAMADAIMAEQLENGMECWRCGERRTVYDPCPNCNEVDPTPF